MGRNDWVESDGRIMPSTIFEPTREQIRSAACKLCGDSGVLIECIDEERYNVTVPCWKCQEYCRICDKHVAKTGHKCVPKKEKKP